jgi:hypothetical protein
MVLICWPWIDAKPTSSLKGSSGLLQQPEPLSGKEKHQDHRCADCQVPHITGRATEATPEALFGLFRDWQRTQTQSSATALRSPKAANGCPVLQGAGTNRREQRCAAAAPDRTNNAPSGARTTKSCFFLDRRLTWMPVMRHRTLS